MWSLSTRSFQQNDVLEPLSRNAYVSTILLLPTAFTFIGTKIVQWLDISICARLSNSRLTWHSQFVPHFQVLLPTYCSWWWLIGIIILWLCTLVKICWVLFFTLLNFAETLFWAISCYVASRQVIIRKTHFFANNNNKTKYKWTLDLMLYPWQDLLKCEKFNIFSLHILCRLVFIRWYSSVLPLFLDLLGCCYRVKVLFYFV